jgi:hypothetical protein
MQITFIADTLADLEAQIRHFLGDQAPVAAAPPRPLPAWAPAGAAWQAMPGAPVLIGPDGAAITVEWHDGVPLPGTVERRHDADAEASGAALLEATDP